MSDVTVPENPSPMMPRRCRTRKMGRRLVVMLRSGLMVTMLRRRSLRNSFSPGC